MYLSLIHILYGRTRSRVQASEMTFIRAVLGVSRLMNDDIRNAFGIYNMNDRIKQFDGPG